MKSTQLTLPFASSDFQRIVTRIQLTWTKLTDRDIAYYLEGRRDKLLAILQRKYRFQSKAQAEIILSDIERLA
jgi:hypothetical protein